ncbi:hypothetical protein [Marinovum algicola]|uniref:hypothetical protein n=1 Tax=Marinovum algicola TaxID=42444 RepID=UPI003B52775D
MRPARWLIETCSVAAMIYASGGALQISLCACAWLMQWRAWIAVWDRVFRPHDPDHCAASFRRCFFDT